ncbi:PadR family transcriptional regulator [Thermocoleostomius sinensis]|jgi:DNA-binding PadR family transcriptional regulator|uniref:PadR family transcriptional regulator n=1 Tax=Thermocoleostomius sinensis A174 TaxID=2016057 RepID=A0A9E9C9B1_9CYAN|nr:PadR family transcriptional regulator [Thermocoleostomius sinensis]WAL61353.1 PadR family transcriptional regulator [Thermocoleostomius sinensis A174]
MFNETASSVNKVEHSSHFASPEEVTTTRKDEKKLKAHQEQVSHRQFAKKDASYEDITISKLEEEILNLLAGKELYGLQIIEAFAESSSGKRTIGVGSLYPTLNRLEEKGLVNSWMKDRPADERGGARRKYFRITQLGLMVMTEAEKFRRKLYEWRPAT